MSKHPNIIGLIKERAEQEVADEWRPPRIPGSFRGSELGDCPRALEYSVRGYDGERPNAELALLFRDGHLHHDALRSELKKVGRVTNEEHSTWKVWDVEYNGKVFTITITTTCDLHFDGQYVGELKGVSTFSFKGLRDNDSVIEKYPHYYTQLQAYLHVYEKDEGFLLFKDKNTSALKIFWFVKDTPHFMEVLQKLAKVMYMSEKKVWIKRPYNKSSYDCKICPFRKPCWGRATDRRTW